MIYDPDDLAGLVIFYNASGKIFREMQFAEFLAVLDRFVPSTELKSNRYKAVYLEVDSRLSLRHCVFFQVAFDDQGFIDESWALPIEDVAAKATLNVATPLGFVKVAHGGNQDEAYRKWLWVPNESLLPNLINVYQKIAKRNNSRLVFSIDSVAPPLLAQTVPVESARNLTPEELLPIGSPISGQPSKVANTDSLKLDIERERAKYQKLLDEQAQLKQRFQSKQVQIQDAIVQKDAEIDTLKEKLAEAERLIVRSEGMYSREYVSQMNQKNVGLMQQVNALEVQNEQLLEQIRTLTIENGYYRESSNDQALLHLTKNGINFVAYQVGAGAMNLAVSELGEYIANPKGFAAKRAGVSQALYLAWLEHTRSPVCIHSNPGGVMCGKSIPRIDTPQDFNPGVSDVCSAHAATTASVFESV